MPRHVYTQEEREAQFLKAGIKQAKKHGIDRLKLSHIAAHCQVSPPLVSHVLGTRAQMRASVVAHAASQGLVLPESGVPVRVRNRRGR